MAMEAPSDGEALLAALHASQASEAEMKTRLMSLQRQLRRAKTEASKDEHKARMQRQTAAIRAQLNQQDLRDSLAGVQPAESVSVHFFSEACNARLCEVDPSRSWMKLFRKVDTDGSGLISFSEYHQLCRSELGLTHAELDDHGLKQVWVALDIDGSGRISAGEFGHFMRLGEHVWRDGAQTWRERLLIKNRATVEEVKKTKDILFNRAVARRAEAAGAVASAEEVKRMSEAFNEALNEADADERSPPGRSGRGESSTGEPHGNWFTIFKLVDTDASGSIDFAELRYLVREKLGVGPATVSGDALAALWVALDTDGSGLISAGEFGSFMRLSEPKMTTLAERRERLAENARTQAAMVRTETRRKKLGLVEERRKEYAQRAAAVAAELAHFRDDEDLHDRSDDSARGHEPMTRRPTGSTLPMISPHRCPSVGRITQRKSPPRGLISAYSSPTGGLRSRVAVGRTNKSPQKARRALRHEQSFPPSQGSSPQQAREESEEEAPEEVSGELVEEEDAE